MADAEERQRVARYVRDRLAEGHLDARMLIDLTGLDPKTVASLLNGERWPQETKRNTVERVLGLPLGRLDDVRRGWFEAPEASSDPVEQAIYRSRLTRANQLKLAGIYYEMLEAQAAVKPHATGTEGQ